MARGGTPAAALHPARPCAYIHCNDSTALAIRITRFTVGGGLDFGWPHFEGPSVLDASCALPLPATGPIYAYDRGASPSAAFVSGGVYRAPAGAPTPFPAEYTGDYFFADYYAGFLRRIVNTAPQLQAPPPVLPPPAVSFAPPCPSPAPGAVHLAYRLPVASTVTIEIFDLRGCKVRVLLPPPPEAALSHDHAWDGLDDAARAAPAGLYIARLTAGGVSRDRRFALLR